MPKRVAVAVDLPLGRQALGWLASVAAWRHYARNTPAEPVLARLYRQHHEQIPWADDAVVELHAALDECGQLDSFDSWRREHPGHAGAWPTREREERRRRLPAL